MDMLLTACPGLQVDALRTITRREQEVLFYLILVAGHPLPGEGSNTILVANLQHSILRSNLFENIFPCVLPGMVPWLITASQQRKAVPEDIFGLQGWFDLDLSSSDGDDYRWWLGVAGNAFHSGSLGATLLAAVVFYDWPT